MKKEPGNKKIMSHRQYWIRKLVKYCRKINGMLSQSLMILDLTNNEEIVFKILPWVFSLDPIVGLECLKKPSKSL